MKDNKKKKTSKKIRSITTYTIAKEKDKSINKISKEEMMALAFSYHEKGNIKQASKYYQAFLDKGFINSKIFTNYALISKEIGSRTIID